MNIKTGQIVWSSSGSYSDYHVGQHFRALRDFDPEEEASRFKREGDYIVTPEPTEWNPEPKPEAYGSQDRFLAWCIREELLDPITDDFELYLGDYSTLDMGATP